MLENIRQNKQLKISKNFQKTKKKKKKKTKQTNTSIQNLL
jgi:hypothetical protein